MNALDSLYYLNASTELTQGLARLTQAQARSKTNNVANRIDGCPVKLDIITLLRLEGATSISGIFGRV